ncbi:hypothetical protein SAMN05216388_10893 [Halorientalis persicus]|uniref:Uncharacterized protein n=1 Tax=Halorientalis persicus TaxID=1367881 RepID=A0A1H8WYF0_9EURY|nr:hypothetical protein [Halorientalis persicus]SEP32636.1 hypothetical protein SAMN05216388_10893 [Halorientalis persicus]
MYDECQNTDCEETTQIEILAPGDWKGSAVDGELHFCGLACLLEFCTDESNFPVCKSTGEMPTDEILVYQPALEIEEAVAAAGVAGGDRDV